MIQPVVTDLVAQLLHRVKAGTRESGEPIGIGAHADSPFSVEPNEGVAAAIFAQRRALEEEEGGGAHEALVERNGGFSVELQGLYEGDRVVALAPQGRNFFERIGLHTSRLDTTVSLYDEGMTKRPTILVIDNIDSFVFNLVQYCEELGADVVVRRVTDITIEDVFAPKYDGVLVSPGPGHPRETPLLFDVIRGCAERDVPLFGVCLGLQAIAETYGTPVVVAPALRHGRSSLVRHSNQGVFAGVANPVVAGRYHSLVADRGALHPDLVVTAETADGLIMGLMHASAPIEGVQFHPESVLTQDGYLMIANWLERCGVTNASTVAHVLNEAAEVRRASLPSPSAT